uniref:Uncharacterized protein n=1 Tax=Corethron hystrix TaxID=216773 RepID=A0A7S1BKH0_9STRA|mmetsp:Transcript_30196/g.69215  ORF Transcript_30196/g.69215 Transcript_30196/m.69215 type:complete len:199 (+) Transcript_30196:55-651(+)
MIRSSGLCRLRSFYRKSPEINIKSVATSLECRLDEQCCSSLIRSDAYDFSQRFCHSTISPFVATSKYFSTTTAPPTNSNITRIGTDDPRMSKIVIHNDTLFISGQTDTTSGDCIASQTRGVLAKIDDLLDQGGTTRAHLLSATIWLRDIERDFKGMNSVWNEWVDSENKPVRATVQSSMAREAILVEIQVVAAMPQIS